MFLRLWFCFFRSATSWPRQPLPPRVSPPSSAMSNTNHRFLRAALSPEEQKKKAAQDRLAQSEYSLAEEMVKDDGSIQRQHLTNASVTELQSFYGEKLKKYAVDNAQDSELQSFARQWSYNINADNVSASNLRRAGGNAYHANCLLYLRHLLNAQNVHTALCRSFPTRSAKCC